MEINKHHFIIDINPHNGFINNIYNKKTQQIIVNKPITYQLISNSYDLLQSATCDIKTTNKGINISYVNNTYELYFTVFIKITNHLEWEFNLNTNEVLDCDLIINQSFIASKDLEIVINKQVMDLNQVDQLNNINQFIIKAYHKKVMKVKCHNINTININNNQALNYTYNITNINDSKIAIYFPNKIYYTRFFIVLLIILLFLGCFTSLKYQPFISYIKNVYDGEINQDYFNQSIYQGIVKGLNNPYSQYLTQEEYLKILNQDKLLGFNTTINYDKLMVSEIVANSPSSKVNILPGDIIKTVNGQNVRFNSDINDYINDGENTITLYRPSDDQNIEVKITGEVLPFLEPTSQIFNENNQKYGYIYIPEFNEKTVAKFTSILTEFKQDKIDHLIIDVCNNPGGDLDSVEGVLNQLVISDKPILEFKHHNRVIDNFTPSLKTPLPFDIAVLQNQNSASASEILSLSLKEYANALIIGTNSYGKGTGQSIEKNLLGPGYLKITKFHWQAANGVNINHQGVTPNIEIKDQYNDFPYIYLDNNLVLNNKGNNALLVNQYLSYIYHNPVNNIISNETLSLIKRFCQEYQISFNNEITSEIVYQLRNVSKAAYNNPTNNPFIKEAIKCMN